MSRPSTSKRLRYLTIDELASMIEEDEDDPVTQHNEIDLVIMPPENACEDVTDEDSGDEDEMTISNLPGSQLRAEAELLHSEDLEESQSDLSSKNRSGSLKKTYKWKKADLKANEILWPEKEYVYNDNSPLELFSLFFDEDVINMIVGYTNEYALKKNKNGDITVSEMKLFIGIMLLSGYVTLPRRRMYWETCQDTHNELVANSLSRDRFEFIISNMHCCSNENLDKNDRFAKVRPLFNAMNAKFQDFAPHNENHSVDEAMVPYFGRHGCKQFICGKPIRDGYKLWVSATNYGYVIWFDPYQGAKGEVKEDYRELGLGASVILQYTDVLTSIEQFPYHLFFDNFFTNVPLIEELSKRNIRSTATIRENRTSNCSLTAKKEMKKKQRGAYDYRVTNDQSLIITRWNDNNIVNIASNALSFRPLHQVTRYSRKERSRVTIQQPHNISAYNANMGGVDRCDQNVSLYRVSTRGKKWYFPLISHCIDLAEQNAWQLHRLQKGKLDHLTFRRRIAMNLLETYQRSSSKRRHSSLDKADSRFDRIDHFIVSQGKQLRCRLCHKKVSTKCEKCDASLHVSCFKPYHTKQ